ncbi:MAG: CDP-diacylglycerol--serine O-phosphatidyltransferase (EC [uncultured Campylobacterales bacterium]|uniref:CDP-diacylglycerol--serine O-phosphatidyltransferase (EC) n=1 Tax=uncultured Campylobacterales bacterium TaxID=352960 RepID=A0A6S6TEC0_9BACT|nr:MAG: CDP-diacylglycerol--serine O-phosphatidyltransferase (EC [uncultured Campylobacterales bacterium]
MFTIVNITCGVLAIYFITSGQFFIAASLAWIGGAFDIFDGKIARKYNLSSEFGIQLDSSADFISFVLVPVMFIFYGVVVNNDPNLYISAIIIIYYVISALRRLINFNINSNEGEVSKYFTGVPTPLGAILLWITYLGFAYGLYSHYLVALGVMGVVGYLLNSKVKIRHP